MPFILFFQTWFLPHFPRNSDGFILVNNGHDPPVFSPNPQLPGVNHCPRWKASPVAPSSPHRGFYAEDGTCERCSPSCRTCEGNATNCHSCERGLVLDHGVCRETCPERHVAVEGVCKHCPEMCQDCIHEKICKGTWEPHRGECGDPLSEGGLSKENWRSQSPYLY